MIDPEILALDVRASMFDYEERDDHPFSRTRLSWKTRERPDLVRLLDYWRVASARVRGLCRVTCSSCPAPVSP